MDNHTSNRIDMLRLICVIMETFKSKYNTIGSMVAYVLNINNAVKAIDQYENIVKGIKGGPAEDKAQKGQLMVQAALKIAASGFSYASDKNDAILKEKMKLVKGDFSSLLDADEANLAEMVYNEINPIIGLLVDYKIKAADMTDLHDKIEAYRSVLVAPRDNTTTGSEARAEVKKQVKIGMDELVKLDKMMIHFNDDDNFEFFDKYTKGRIIVDAGHRFRKPICYISGLCIDFETEKPILGAEIWIQGEEKYKVMSGEAGAYKIGVHTVGDQLILCKKDGYKQSEEIENIVKGIDIDMNIELEAETPSEPTPPTP